MTPSVDVIRGKIVEYSPDGMIRIEAQYPSLARFIKRGYEDVEIRLIDTRPISNKQRNTCYALIRAISEYTGQGVDQTKEILKRNFLLETFGDDQESFSLSDVPVSMAAAFQNYLVNFLLEWDIPTSFPLMDFVDDTSHYLYSCVANKKCCICGRHADVHHWNRVGIGRDRKTIIHTGMQVLPLCRVHHTECHQIGQKTFDDKYHIQNPVTLTRELCAIYGLKTEAD